MITTSKDEIIGILKVQQWEKIKGELNALVALHGSCRSTSQYAENFEEIQKKVHDFIFDIEEQELYY